jgi:hypothetical protein
MIFSCAKTFKTAEVFDQYKAFLPLISTIYPGFTYFWQLHLFLFLFSFVIFFPIIRPKNNSVIIEKITKDIEEKKKILEEMKEKMKEAAKEEKEFMKIFQGQLKFEIEKLENIKYFCSFNVLGFCFFSSILQAIRTSLLPTSVTSTLSIENKFSMFNERFFNNYLEIIEKHDKDSLNSYRNYFRSIFLWQKSSFFILYSLTNIATKAYARKIDELKQIMFDNFLGNMLNQYRLILRPLNFLRFYQDFRMLKKMALTIKNFSSILRKKEKFPHLLFVGDKENSLYFVFGLQQLIPFLKINNIDFYQEKKNPFK